MTSSGERTTAPSAAHEKYIFKPFFGSSHSWAIEELRDLTAPARILDIGPGSGGMAKVLAALGHKDIYAVEPDRETQKFIAPLYRGIEETIEPFASERFDLILLLDVLEHMADPFSFIKVIQTMLAPGGTLLISVPNIAHWSIRLSLLFGFFEYSQRGLLDRTHLQFFNRRRFKNLLCAADELKVLSTAASIEPAELVVPEWISQTKFFKLGAILRLRAANAMPNLMAYQHLAKLTRLHS